MISPQELRPRREFPTAITESHVLFNGQIAFVSVKATDFPSEH